MFCVYVGIKFDENSKKNNTTIKCVKTKNGLTNFRHEFFIITNCKKTKRIMNELIRYTDDYINLDSWCKP